MAFPRCALISFTNDRLSCLSLTHSEFATPDFSTIACTSAHRLSTSTVTAYVRAAVATLSALSVAVAFSVCGPRPNDHAGPLADGQVAAAMPESASMATQVTFTVCATV